MSSVRAALAVVLAGSPLPVIAQSIPTAPSPFIEEQRQQERERALRERNERPVSERPPTAIALEVKRIPESESPCLRFDRIALVGEGAESFQWSIVDLSGPQGDDSPLGRCLGVKGLDVVTGRVQQALIQRGFATTRALAEPQDLRDGVFTITLIPGRITAIRLSPDSSARVRDTPILAAAIPAEPGDLFNARDIEQGLENLKRASTADADIRIQASAAPDAGPGDSELVVRYVQPRILRATVSADDSGTEATGKYQGSLTLSADDPLGLNDQFYLSLNHNLAGHPHKRGTEGQTWHYSVPRGYWLFGVTASDSSYFQRVAGANQDYVFGGASTHYEAKLSRLIHRDQQRKLGVYLRGFQRASSNRIDDTEIEVQRRKVGGWEFGLNHREFLGRATIDATLAYRRGTGAFGTIAAPEESFGEGSSRFKLYTAELGLNAPFKLGEQKMRYAGLVRSQWNRTPLTPQDRFAIGSRYTVRGFDGETSLLGDRGMLIRNDVGWIVGENGVELYAGADYGQVGGKSSEQLLGDHLAGAVVGVRGNWSKLSYDFFAGAPIAKPQGYRTARVAAGFALSASF